MKSVVALLGASDPEMAEIERLLRAAGVEVFHASVGGRRCHPGNAYSADGPAVPPGGTGTVLRVECDAAPGSPLADQLAASEVSVIDHHRPGDPGYGRPPGEFLAASSLGQTISWLARRGALPYGWEPSAVSRPWCRARIQEGRRVVWDGDQWVAIQHYVLDQHPKGLLIPSGLVLAAAGDHCPAAAYAGQCTGVDPDELLRWRISSRAAFQGRSEAEILADVAAARVTIAAAPKTDLAPGVEVRDLRCRTIPELPEALLRAGEAALAAVIERDGRRKVVLIGAGEGSLAGRAPVEAFLGGWAARAGLADLYGDPDRGYAGGYLPAPPLRTLRGGPPLRGQP